MICKCPAGAALPDIPVSNCPESFGQIQKVAFQRLYKSTGEKNSFTTDAGIEKKASWTPLLSADDDTKIVISPYIQAPTAEAGAPRTFGGGNETLGGVEEIVGREPTPFTGVMRKLPQKIIKALKELQCESWGDNLGVYLFNENGAIGAIQDAKTATTHYPIPIRLCLSAIKHWADMRHRIATIFNGHFCRIGRMIWQLLFRRISTR